MTKTRLARRLEASVEVAAPPQEVWKVVADVERTGEWSPECRRVKLVGQLRQGAWLVGFNRRRRVRWTTLSRITSLEPGREIGWKVTTNGAVWSYRLESTDGGSRLTETRETPKGVAGFARAFTRLLLGGQIAHDDELESGMTRGLERIRELAELRR